MEVLAGVGTLVLAGAGTIGAGPTPVGAGTMASITETSPLIEHVGGMPIHPSMAMPLEDDPMFPIGVWPIIHG